MLRSSKNLSVLGLSVFLVALSGCKATYDHTDITEVGGGTLSQDIDIKQADLSVGDVLTATITPFNSDDNPMVESVESKDPSIVQVLVTTRVGEYAFLGVAVGTTQVALRADGEVVDVLTFNVHAQP